MSQQFERISATLPVDYRRMTPELKALAVEGNMTAQRIWMVEEIDEFYEAMLIGSLDDISEEFFGLLRTASQFPTTKELLYPHLNAFRMVLDYFSDDEAMDKEYKKFEAKKHAKGQALDMQAADLCAVFQDVIAWHAIPDEYDGPMDYPSVEDGCYCY